LRKNAVWKADLLEYNLSIMGERSYAEELRHTLAELPVKKKCCLHALRDAAELYDGSLDEESRAREIRRYEERAKCPGCTVHFIRALFCSHGSVTDPAKRYHLEFAFSGESECAALAGLLEAQGVNMSISVRKKQHILYLKDGEAIADFLAYIGANTAAFDFMNSRINREFRNAVNRQVNCDMANIGKALSAAQKQISVLERMQESGLINKLPESLKETAILRMKHTQLSLKELGDIHTPPITKSGVTHRLSKITEFAKANDLEF